MKHGEHDSKKRIAFPIQLFQEGSAFAEITDEIHVVPTGEWEHPVYGEMRITSDDIAEFKRNFDAKVRLKLPITAGHDNGMSGGELPAIGWFKEVTDRGVKGLYAFVEWTEEGKKLLNDGAFKYFSPEFYEQYSDPETGEKRSHVLVGGALTNRPYFRELDPVVAFSEPGIMNQFKEPMDLKTILAKKAEDLSADEKAFVREHKAELDADQQSAFASVLEDNNPEPEPTPEPTPEPEPNPEPPVVAAEPKGKMITMSEAEATVLREQADKGAKAFAEIEKMKLGAEVDKLVFSASNAVKGRILPKHKDAVVELLFSLPNKQRDQLRSVLNNLPKPDASIFSEIGDGGAGDAGDSKSLYKKISEMANAKVTASEGKTKFSDALLQVYSENPGLKKQYEEALAADAK
jgi:hypothetical protein